MRTRSGWALSVLGVLLALGGIAVMVVLGPDSRFTTGPHAIETDDIAVVTAPKVVRWADVKVDLLAEVPVRKPIFIGLGNTVDVQDYVAKTQHLEITRFERPWKISTRDVEGQPNLPGAPTALDWWIETSDGLGGASISTELPDETVSIAILSVGSSNLGGLEVTLAYGVNNGFRKGIAVLLLGLALVVIGVLVRRGAFSRTDDDLDDGLDDGEDADVIEEVVYVYIDDDGVEHEISAEEAAELEVVEEVEEVEGDQVVEDVVAAHDEQPTEPSTEPPALPTVPQVVVPGVLTAADFAAGRDEPDVVAPPVPDDSVVAPPVPDDSVVAPPVTDDSVVYVFVDEDGVEHQVSEDELAEFEIVDEDDDGLPPQGDRS